MKVLLLLCTCKDIRLDLVKPRGCICAKPHDTYLKFFKKQLYTKIHVRNTKAALENASKHINPFRIGATNSQHSIFKNLTTVRKATPEGGVVILLFFSEHFGLFSLVFAVVIHTIILTRYSKVSLKVRLSLQCCAKHGTIFFNSRRTRPVCRINIGHLPYKHRPSPMGIP